MRNNDYYDQDEENEMNEGKETDISYMLDEMQESLEEAVDSIERELDWLASALKIMDQRLVMILNRTDIITRSTFDVYQKVSGIGKGGSGNEDNGRVREDR